MASNINYLKGANLALDNARQLLKVSDAAATLTYYGAASSLAILSTEEAIKAFGCINNHYAPELIDPNFKKLFYLHRVKHESIKQLLKFMALLLDNSKVMIERIDVNLEEFLTLGQKVATSRETSSIKLMIKHLRNVSAINLPSESEMLSWWDSADQQKNNGLYVGLNQDQWHDPNSTSQEFYAECAAYAQLVSDYAIAAMSFWALFKIAHTLGIMN